MSGTIRANKIMKLLTYCDNQLRKIAQQPPSLVSSVDISHVQQVLPYAVLIAQVSLPCSLTDGREVLSIFACASCIAVDPSSIVIDLSKVFLLHLVCLRCVPLHHRAHSLEGVKYTTSKYFTGAAQFLNSISTFMNEGLSSPLGGPSWADLMDGRLFYKLLEVLVKFEVPS